jgi:pseudaminic acid biosynthesis-associated methylase
MWEGDFGNNYTIGNPVDWVRRVLPFANIVGPLKPDSILEVGCNRGHNLMSLSKVTPESCQIAGVEPNAFALEVAQTSKLKVVKGNAFSIPFRDGQFNLVMTSAVLSHIHTSHLLYALREIYRVSNQYILAIEYYSPSEEEVEYRGKGLWRRNYYQSYLEYIPTLTLVKEGFLGHTDGFDDLNFWVLAK